MIDNFNERVVQGTGQNLAFSEGLRQYMLSVYNYMFLGLGLTGAVAFVVATTPAIQQIVMPMWIVFALAPIGIVLYMTFRAQSLSPASAQMWFWIYAAVNGVTFSAIFMMYTMPSVARVFLITACTFGAMSLYGYTTKKDLTSMGSFLMMGVFGILIASIVNMFMHSSALHFAISVIGVLVFTGLTAYDTQNIKDSYAEGYEEGTYQKQAIFGALRLYLDFINLFIMMLRLLGDRR